MSKIEWLNFFLTSFISLFAIMNPLGNTAVFLGMTEGRTEGEKKRIALRAALTSFIVILGFILAGKQILFFFRITIPAFEIAAGVLIFIIGLTMLSAFRLWMKSTPNEEKEAAARVSERQDVAIIPLGIPIVSGPGAITTAMVLAFQRPGIEARITVVVAAALVSIITYFVFAESTYLFRLLKQTGINILTRLMGLLLTVMAVQFLINGLKMAFPFLAR